MGGGNPDMSAPSVKGALILSTDSFIAKPSRGIAASA